MVFVLVIVIARSQYYWTLGCLVAIVIGQSSSYDVIFLILIVAN